MILEAGHVGYEGIRDEVAAWCEVARHVFQTADLLDLAGKREEDTGDGVAVGRCLLAFHEGIEPRLGPSGNGA